MRYPCFKWRDAAEKEWTFRALYALGYSRMDITDVNLAWRRLSHDADLHQMSVDLWQNIKFWSTMHRDKRWTLVNSGCAMIDYLKLHANRTPQ